MGGGGRGRVEVAVRICGRVRAAALCRVSFAIHGRRGARVYETRRGGVDDGGEAGDVVEGRRANLGSSRRFVGGGNGRNDCTRQGLPFSRSFFATMSSARDKVLSVASARLRRRLAVPGGLLGPIRRSVTKRQCQLMAQASFTRTTDVGRSRVSVPPAASHRSRVQGVLRPLRRSARRLSSTPALHCDRALR